MNIDILTLFPNSFDFLRSYGVIGKAVENNLINISTVDIRSFSKDKHKKVDDEVYGGSAGMLMKVEPVIDAIESVKKEKSKVIFLSPQGRVFNQEIANELSKEEHIILLCGHYEGIDSRVVNNYVDFELSIGDYVLTGGEIPAMVVIDATARLVANVIGKEESYQTDSHYNILLQHDHFTRPREYRGLKVPEVLFSGNHKLIEEWQKNSSIENTKRKRPDLYKKYIESLRKG
ncbi:tRNA (guanosine(37)-N1)-methyltransferase TrmD [Helcococcus kunzii]|uniref:tRNA (guanine-N(1)-)-methyltransferase n=1 Tax=Helcococcus kunzii ATCC 51366 TaxID=883114 RepID=H3NNG1_9FIRM|nr:tRNA (guanosine(37)-N1)-methyltransferase TrmD [Helcococcus kunzii]EHR33936.1 tRNA (guanine-N1)-methyltransferase [Helcococcus kunzii ATCC 51366]MCT1795545.1 tRNA (guanosine(37)-N1)-methyltransferase TrmD [Helcococcus kunzii]MCT1989807.1 tRNA (guanosine(37)-N1)-methyltransferase TrmD [Helcococcus kunzii]QUY64787.1 tRNA (guanosine(37)-N1)-methyltransferase TrmD [Helcococcus kunzii]QZO77228.1 tRNA (guanosine(37)-N1)-methyltransferase TrmD [Helcococcus kunzii]